MVDEKEPRPTNWRPTQAEAVSAWLDAQLDNPARLVPLVLGADHELTVCARVREWRIFEPNFDFLAAHDSLPVRSLVALSVGLHPFFGDEAWVYQDALPYFQGRRDPDTDLAFDEDDQNECARAVTQLSTFIQRVSIALSALRAGTLPNTHNGVGGPETTATEFWAFARARGWDVPDALVRESGGAAPVKGRIHTTKPRTSTLAAVIAQARQKALDANDWTSVWAELVAMASSDDRPAPLLGYTEGEGVKYQKDSDTEPVAYLSRGAFRKRMERELKPVSGQ